MTRLSRFSNRVLGLKASLMPLAACAGRAQMAGFSEKDATVRTTTPVLFSACDIRSGRLILEIERAQIREYPKSFSDNFEEKKQPMLLVWVNYPVAGPGAESLYPVIAPEEYRAADRIRYFDGKRVLDKPGRLLTGRKITLRLAENNRSFETKWRSIASQIGHSVSSVSGEVGVSLPSPGLWDLALNQVQQLDRDDLILLWSYDLDEIAKGLGPQKNRRALRFSLASTREAKAQTGTPAAELDILFYWEPEVGCDWQ